MTGPPAADVRLIAFYLPQFHPVPENDEWWGPGFTEWTNVASARRLYPGHRQPRLPGRLGFYDLRVPETRDAQAELARAAGIEAFCYWHYWFGNGRRILERPFEEVLASGRPDFGFCLGWANQSWTGVWHGAQDRVLIQQTYPGPDDDRAHFRWMLPALRDARYVRVDGRPLLHVHDPLDLPEPAAWIERWRELAADAGLPGLYLVTEAPPGFDAAAVGFDAHFVIPWKEFISSRPRRHKLLERLLRLPRRVPFDRLSEHVLRGPWPADRHPCVIPNWDNTPRSGRRGVVVTGSAPDRWEDQLRSAIAIARQREPDQRLVFVKSWNEWAEGNHLEPDRLHGDRWLEATVRALRDDPH